MKKIIPEFDSFKGSVNSQDTAKRAKKAIFSEYPHGNEDYFLTKASNTLVVLYDILVYILHLFGLIYE